MSLTRDEALAVILKQPGMTPARAEAAYDAVLAERAVQEAETEEGNHIGTVEPDATEEGADWIRRVARSEPPVEK